MDIGATLRSARERRGLSLESLSRITRIKAAYLRDIESNAFDKVPAGIFLRGFLRSYAREVGLEPEVVVRGYLADLEPTPAQPPVSISPSRVDHPGRERARPQTTIDAAWLRPRVNAQWAAVAIIVAAFAGYTILAPRLGAARAARSAGSATAAARLAAVPREPGLAGPAFRSGGPAPVGTSGSALQVDIAPTGPCWISASADGEPVAYGLLQAGDRRSIRVHDALVLRVGDPAAFAYTVNGAPGRPLGRAAEPVTVTIAPGNFREFLAAPRRPGS